MRPRLRLLPFLTAALLPAQGPAVPQELESLAVRVAATHRPTGSKEPVTSFRATLAVKQVGRADQQRGEVELAATFLQWRREDGAVRPLLRYRIVDDSKPAERGLDRQGCWAVLDGVVRDLDGKDTATDAEQVRRQVANARQLLRFLDPAAVLRGLQRPSPVQKEDLVLGREAPRHCLTVSGDADDFPMQRTGALGDGPHAVRVKVWVDQDEARLLGVETTALAKDGTALPGTTEFVQLLDPRVQDGFLVPMQLRHFEVDAAGKRSLRTQITLTTLQLGCKVEPADFDRPRK